MAEDKYIVLARVAEGAERFDEMADFMGQRVQSGVPLNAEEREMFSAAFKRALQGRRQAVRVSVGVAAQEEADGHNQLAELAEGYKSKVEAELQDICMKALNLLVQFLVPSCGDAGDDKTFYLKMQGDYCRYAAEFAQSEARHDHAEKASAAYTAGLEAGAALPAFHPVQLGLALNYSVFLHEVRRETDTAVATAQKAYQKAEAELASCTDTNMRNDAILTMQLLRDNLTLWAQ